MIKDLLEKAFILKNKGYYKNALEIFYKALELDDSSLELFLEIAKCYYAMGDEEHSINYIEIILEKNPVHINALIFLKQLFLDKKSWLEAENSAKTIYAITKKTEDLAEIFEILNIQKRYSEIFDYKIEEDNSIILFQKAYAKMFLNELSEAERYINKALNYDYNNKNILLKAKILFKSQKIEECISLLEQVNFQEKDSDFLNFLGVIKQSQCEFYEAIRYFREAIKLAPKKDEYYYNCASTYFKMNDNLLAKKYYNKAISLAPENSNYHFALANLYYSEKNYKRALEELTEDFFESNMLKAIILFDSGYYVLAKKEFDKLYLSNPENELLKEYRLKLEELFAI